MISRDIETNDSAQLDAIIDENKNIPETNRRINTRERVPIMKKNFYKLKISPSNTPFFTRVWYIRHRLDIDSPLLKPSIKEMINANQGRWPNELNDYYEIRNALISFRRIVSINDSLHRPIHLIIVSKNILFSFSYCMWLLQRWSHFQVLRS